jgi:hypothetical protein
MVIVPTWPSRPSVSLVKSIVVAMVDSEMESEVGEVLVDDFSE